MRGTHFHSLCDRYTQVAEVVTDKAALKAIKRVSKTLLGGGGE